MTQVFLVPLRYLTFALSAALLVACSSEQSDDAQTDVVTAPTDVVTPPDEGVTPPDENVDEPIEPIEPIEPVVVPDPQVSATFENNFQGWLDALTGDATTVDFESVPSLSRRLIVGNEFADNVGSPVFTQLEGVGMFVGNPSGENQIISPVSGINSFFMGCDPVCEGIVRVDFSAPINAFGAFFVDVEADFATTGFSLSDTLLPEVAFSSQQGQNAQSHLGFTSDFPFSAVYIHFSTGPTDDGAAMDDMSYVVVDATAEN